MKVIHDPVHGSIQLDDQTRKLLSTAEVQRLRHIKQMGLANLVFPGANHTRFEHSLGVLHLSRLFSQDLGIESRVLFAAALLHDIGHPPLSHTLEFQMIEYSGKNHEEMAVSLLQGEAKLGQDLPSCGEVLGKLGLDVQEVCDLIVGRHREVYLSQLLHGEMDVDQMDYLLRDSHFTGVALGLIDLPRIRRVLLLKKGRLVVKRSGVEAVEGFLTARNLMYSSVYFHPTVRIAELMLANAVDVLVERGEDPYLCTDWQLFSKLEALGGYAGEMLRRICCRKLFAPAYVVEKTEVGEKTLLRIKKRLNRWSRIRELQREICERAGVPEGKVVVDIPLVEIIVSEPRVDKVGMLVLRDGKTIPLSEISPLAQALRRKKAFRYLLQVCTLPQYKRRVAKVSEEVLGWLG